MELNVGVIRDKPGIYSGLWQSRSTNQQLAICYNSGGKLLVKICTVKEINGTDKDAMVTLVGPDEESAEVEIPLDSILSIYPIRDFA